MRLPTKYDISIFSFIMFGYIVLAYPLEIQFHIRFSYAFDFLLLVLLLKSTFAYKHKPSNILIIVLLILLVLTGNFLASSFVFYQVLRTIRFILISYLLFQYIVRLPDKSHIDRIYRIIILSAFASSIWLLRQYIIGWTPAEKIWIVSTLNSSPDIMYIGTTRFFATFPYANVASLFFSLSFFVSLSNIHKGKLFFWGLIISALSIVLVQMRIGYFVAILVLLLYINKRNFKYVLLFSLLLLLIATVNSSVNIISSDYFSYIINKLTDSGSVNDSVYSRLLQISSGLQYLFVSPLTVLFGRGLGVENLEVYIDNLFVTILYQYGVLFCIILIIVFIAIISKNKALGFPVNRKNLVVILLIAFLFSMTSNALNSGIVYNVFLTCFAIYFHSSKSSFYKI